VFRLVPLQIPVPIPTRRWWLLGYLAVGWIVTDYTWRHKRGLHAF